MMMMTTISTKKVLVIWVHNYQMFRGRMEKVPSPWNTWLATGWGTSSYFSAFQILYLISFVHNYPQPLLWSLSIARETNSLTHLSQVRGEGPYQALDDMNTRNPGCSTPWCYLSSSKIWNNRAINCASVGTKNLGNTEVWSKNNKNTIVVLKITK